MTRMADNNYVTETKVVREKVVRENFSQKRTAILKTLQETDTHPTADWVYEKLKPRYPNLSLGTVYRNLKKLSEAGKIKSIGVINGQEHFDGTLDTHSHLVCKKCGAIHDIDAEVVENDKISKLSEMCQHELHEVEVLFRGVCKWCSDLIEGEQNSIQDADFQPVV